MRTWRVLAPCVVATLSTPGLSQCAIGVDPTDGWPPVTDRDIWAMASMPNGDLIVGGDFTSAGGVTVNKIARWNGTSWSTLGPGLNGWWAKALAVLPDGGLIAGGAFNWVGPAWGLAVNSITRWDGTSWSALGTGMGYATVCCGEVHSLAVLPSGDVIAGGKFARAGGAWADNIARWDGASWSVLGTGVGYPEHCCGANVRALAVLSNGDLIAGGQFTTAGGTPVNHIARWDGVSWSAMGTGINGRWDGWGAVTALAVLPNGDLIAGGAFTMAGGTAASNIARWDGTAWSSPGTGINGPVNALAVLPNGDLIAGGVFSSAGGEAASNLARWNGMSWSAMGTGVDGGVDAMTVLPGDRLAVGGVFAGLDGEAAFRVAIFSLRGLVSITTHPRDVSVPPGGRFAFEVEADGTILSYRWRRNGVELFDDDRHAGAATPTLTISSVSHDDQGWYSCVITNACEARESREALLFVGCLADHNRDGGVDGSDVVEFFLDWEAGASESDVNLDGGIDGLDLFSFFDAWETGC